VFDELDEEFDEIFAKHDLPEALLEEVRSKAREVLERLDGGIWDREREGCPTLTACTYTE
jgi:hypothetical protein